MFGYSLNYLIDIENAVIVDVEATPTRISREVDATETMIERTEERFALKPDHLAGDVAYGTGEMLGWLVGRDIDPHIPVKDQSEIAPDGKFTRADFAYDKERDLYICSGGKKLKTSGTVHGGAKLPGFRLLRVCNLQDLGKTALRLRVMLGRQGQSRSPLMRVIPRSADNDS